MNIKVFKNIEELIDSLAAKIVEVAEQAIAERGCFNFVLSGGNSPRKLYECLASDSYKKQIDWEKVYFFFGDERFVPAEDSERNSLMAEEAIFKPLKIKKSHIFAVNTENSPQEAASGYMEDIQEHFGTKPIQFDFTLLGLGSDGHTASLFPNTEVLKEIKPTVKSEFIKKLNKNRITMTAPLINASRNIAFLVYGKEKAEAVFQVIEDKTASSNDFPAKLISAESEKTSWYLDTKAAKKKEKRTKDI